MRTPCEIIWTIYWSYIDTLCGITSTTFHIRLSKGIRMEHAISCPRHKSQGAHYWTNTACIDHPMIYHAVNQIWKRPPFVDNFPRFSKQNSQLFHCFSIRSPSLHLERTRAQRVLRDATEMKHSCDFPARNGDQTPSILLCPLVNWRSCWKSPFLMGKSTIHGHFQ